MLEQLKINAPPALAVISGDGSVYQQYTGWIDQKVMEQVVANAVREQYRSGNGPQPSRPGGPSSTPAPCACRPVAVRSRRPALVPLASPRAC